MAGVVLFLVLIIQFTAVLLGDKDEEVDVVLLVEDDAVEDDAVVIEVFG